VAVLTACAVLALREFTRYPGQAGHAAVPGAGRHSGLAGLAAALTAGLVFALGQPAGGQSDSPVLTPVVMALGICALLAAGALAALPGVVRRRGITQSLRVGAAEVMWGVLLTGPVVFSAVLLTTSRTAISAEAAEPVIRAEAYQQGAASVAAWIAHDDLGGAIVMLTFLSVAIALVFAIAHALLAVSDVPTLTQAE
jgi:hypothetical protein